MGKEGCCAALSLSGGLNGGGLVGGRGLVGGLVGGLVALFVKETGIESIFWILS